MDNKIQNAAINMKYDTLQTQMDTGKKKATKGNLWVEIPF